MAKLQQPLLLNLPEEDPELIMEPSSPSSRFMSRLRGFAPATDTSQAGSAPPSPVARMNMRTFLQGLTTERGPLSSALLDFATSAREEELSSAFRSPVEEFFHERERGLLQGAVQETEAVKDFPEEKSVEQYNEPGPLVPNTTAGTAVTGPVKEAGGFRPAEMESQETDYTMLVANSCASTEGSCVQESRAPTKPSPKTADLSRHCLNIIDESKEWGEMSSTLEDTCDRLPGGAAAAPRSPGARSPRAAQIEVNSSTLVNHVDPNLVRCGNWCLFFFEMWISTGCILLCAARLDWCLCFLLALPHTLLVGIEVQLIARDWAFQRNLHALRSSSRGKAMFFKSIVFLLFGFLSCLPVMRARQCWKQRGMRASLVDEIETPSGGPAMESARVDSHVMFVTNVPRIMVLLYASTSLVYTELELCLLLSMAFLSLVNVLQASVNFDYYASKWIRDQYESLSPFNGFPFQFQALHHAYRLCEIALRILTLLLVTEVLRFQVSLGVLYLCLDYVLGTAAFYRVAGLQTPGSRMVLILSVSIYVFDCCRFIDEQGLTRQARQVSKMLRALRSGQTALVLPLLWCIQPSSERMVSHIFWPSWAVLMGLLAVVWLLEKCTRLQHRAVDIFIACKKGMVQEATELLDAGCDCNLRQEDGSTPLHVAAGCGQSECVEVLLRRGADPLLCDVEGETALHRACRHGHARCIRLLLHPPVDAPCVLRGDFLDCALQVNKLRQRPLQLLEAAGKSWDLIEELAEFQHQPDLKRSWSSQLAPSPTRSTSGELHGVAQSLFGQVLKNSESRFLVASKHSGVGSRNLAGFLFTTGIGEQMAEVLDNETPQVPQVGPQLTTLRTQGVLGAGAFGKVFKVLDVCSSEVYALKLQRRDSTTKFAVREAEALHRSSHAFIVRLIHIFQTQSYYALLMELCDKSLNACILDSCDDSGQILGLADEPTKRYAACITLALEYLHQQKVVFRDLKPDNVLITFKDNVAKLADFGLARSLSLDSMEHRGSEESSSDKLSPRVSSTVCGTPRFMAPEVYEEFLLVDSDDEEDAIRRLLSRDWYALGCCLLLMLLGQEAGSLAEANGRRVLLPPSGQAEITCSLRKASKRGRIDEDALHLIDSLTAPVEVRFDASDLRCQPFLQQVIVEMEHFAVRTQPAMPAEQGAKR